MKKFDVKLIVEWKIHNGQAYCWSEWQIDHPIEELLDIMAKNLNWWTTKKQKDSRVYLSYQTNTLWSQQEIEDGFAKIIRIAERIENEYDTFKKLLEAAKREGEQNGEQEK